MAITECVSSKGCGHILITMCNITPLGTIKSIITDMKLKHTAL